MKVKEEKVVSLLNDILVDLKQNVSDNCFDIIFSIINKYIIDIESIINKKREIQNKRFDLFHSDFNVLKERGWVGKPTKFHKVLSDFTLEKLSPDEAFLSFDENDRYRLLSSLINKNMNEQIVAYRHNFWFITYNHGHDGIDEQNNVYEAKSVQYNPSKKSNDLNFSFAFISPNTLRKFKEGKPDIILNMYKNHKLLIELKIEFGEKIIKKYEQAIEDGKEKLTYTFEDYKDHIKEISYVDDEFFILNINSKLKRFIKEKLG
jgi:hypothetical protein